MNAQQLEILQYAASGFILVILPILFIGNFWLRGFFWKFVKVKTSMGRYFLVRVNTMTSTYWTVGEPIGSAIRWCDRKKAWHTTPLTTSGLVFQSFGVNCLDLDEETEAFFRRDGSAVSANNGEVTDSLILRALNKPIPQDLIKIITLVVVILSFVLLIGLLALTVKMNGQLANLATVGKGVVQAGVA